MNHVEAFRKITCVVSDDPSANKFPDEPFKLKAVKVFVVPPVNCTRPIAVLVMLANLLEPEIVSVPVPPWLIVGHVWMLPPAKVLVNADVRLIVPVPVTVRFVEVAQFQAEEPLAAIVQVPEPIAKVLALDTVDEKPPEDSVKL